MPRYVHTLLTLLELWDMSSDKWASLAVNKLAHAHAGVFKGLTLLSRLENGNRKRQGSHC